jgi:hypothetical protein
MKMLPTNGIDQSELMLEIVPSGFNVPTEQCGGETGLKPKKISSPVDGNTFGCAVKGT